MLTGDHWTAEESYRMGIPQQIAATPEAALAAGVAIARKIAACAAVDHDDADVRAPVRRSGGSRRALKAWRSVRRTL